MVTRRHFFEQARSASAASRSRRWWTGRARAQAQRADGSRPARLQFAPRVKRVIYLFMAGAPSQIDLFDPKPALTKHDGQDIPAELIKGERFAFIKGTPKLLGVAVPVQATRPVRRGDLGAAAAPGEVRRRHRRSFARCRRRSSITRRRRSS